MKVAVPGAGRINQALRALPGVRPRSDRSAAKSHKRAPSETFRLLALNTRILLPVDSRPAVAVMSAFPRDGRSFVAANLALALAEEGPVMLVEQIAEKMTLSDRLAARRNGSDSTVPGALRNRLLSTDHPGVFLHATPRVRSSGSLAMTVKDAAEAGFFTVVDSPPALTSSSAFLLAREVGQVIYVVTRKVQDVDVHRQVREQLDRLGVEILGLVVNEA